MSSQNMFHATDTAAISTPIAATVGVVQSATVTMAM